jgi:hypothetical protein
VQVSDINGQAAADAVRFVPVTVTPNPVPALTSLSPPGATAGGPAFTLTVNGSGFVAGSVVRWNGAGRPTTFVSAAQVTAAISAADIAAPGTPTVTVFNPAPGGGLSNSLTFTINPPPPTVTITASTPTATEAGASPGAFTVSRTGSTTAALTVSYTVSGTATAGSDYVTLPGSVTIPSGSLSAPIPVTPIDDPAVEPNETVIVTLSASAAYTVGSPAAATVTIVSNDVAATEIILDNLPAGTQDAARTFTGTWCVSGGSSRFGVDSLYSCGAGVDTYRWTPTIPAAGTYDVYVWWSYHPMRSTNVPITVTHAAGSTMLTFNEQLPGGMWVLHGRYGFNGGTAGFVQVSDVNGQAAADAVRFVPVP